MSKLELDNLGMEPSMEPTTDTSISKSDKPRKPSLMELPTELHLQITSYLIYPDALSLKHTNRHFYDLVYTGVNLKIEWLIERRQLHLDCPHDKGCELGSDLRFCRGSVRLLMKRRREHGECDKAPGGRGCLVFGTKVCTFRKDIGKLEEMRRWARRFVRNTTTLEWILLGMVGIAIAWWWMQTRKAEVEA